LALSEEENNWDKVGRRSRLKLLGRKAMKGKERRKKKRTSPHEGEM